MFYENKELSASMDMVISLVDGACDPMPDDEKRMVIEKLVAMANDKLAVGQGEPIHG